MTADEWRPVCGVCGWQGPLADVDVSTGSAVLVDADGAEVVEPDCPVCGSDDVSFEGLG